MDSVGRDGLTHNMLELIHTHWRRQPVCKVRCLGVPTIDMNNVCTWIEVVVFAQLSNAFKCREFVIQVLLFTFTVIYWICSAVSLEFKCPGIECLPTVSCSYRKNPVERLFIG